MVLPISNHALVQVLFCSIGGFLCMYGWPACISPKSQHNNLVSSLHSKEPLPGPQDPCSPVEVLLDRDLCLSPALALAPLHPSCGAVRGLYTCGRDMRLGEPCARKSPRDAECSF